MYSTLRKRVVVCCIGHAITNIALAIGVWSSVGQVGNSPAWALMERVFPAWVWPAFFLLIGVLGAFGTISMVCAKLSFYLAAAAMWGWGVATGWAWITGQGPQPGALLLIYVGVLKWMVAEFILTEERTLNTLDSAAHEAVESTKGTLHHHARYT